MINVKYCKKCRNGFDFEKCPYCKQIKKEEVKNERSKNCL